MKPSRDIKSITYMKTRSADLLATVSRKRQPIVITQKGEARAVIQDVQSFEEQQELIALLKLVAQGEHEIKHKKVVSQAKAFTFIEDMLRGK